MDSRIESRTGQGDPAAVNRWHGVVLIAILLASIAAPARGNDSAARASAAAARITRKATHLEREMAVSVLTGLGPGALDAVRELASAPEAFRRLAAVEVLIGLRRDAAAFVPFLDDRSFAVRTAALEGIRNAFGRHGGRIRPPERAPAIDVVKPCLADPFWPVRRAAVIALAASGSPEAAGPVLSALNDPEPEVRRAALHFFSELNADIPALELREAAAGLDPAARAQFMRYAFSLARRENAPFYLDEARSFAEQAAGLWALAGAVAADDPEACRTAVERLPDLVAISIASEREQAAPAGMLLAWAAERHRNALVRAMEDLMKGEGPGPEQVIPHLAVLLRKESVPILVDWAGRHIDEPRICGLCVAHLDTGYTAEGAAALAGLIPRLRDGLRRRAVDKAAHFIEQAPGGELLRALAAVALEDPPETAVTAFGALCRIDGLDPALAASLIERFRVERDPALRSALARFLPNAGRGSNRAAVWQALIEEIEERRPAAVTAGIFIDKATGPPRVERTAAAVTGLTGELTTVEERENMLLALCRLGDPGSDAFLARETETLWKENDPSWACRLATAFGRLEGEATAGLLKRMAAQDDMSLKKRAIQALLARRDPDGIAAARREYPQLSSIAKSTLLGEIGALGLSREAADIVTRAVLEEKDSDILEAAVDALDDATVRELEGRLQAMVRDPAAAGMEAARAAIRALARSGGPKAILFLKEIATGLPPLPGEATSPAEVPAEEHLTEADLEERVDLACTAACALARRGDPESTGILSGLLLREARSRREEVVLETWIAESGGPQAQEAHIHLRNVLIHGLLLLPDESIESALLEELDRLEESGAIFVMGDAALGVAFRELHVRGRCPRVRARLHDLVIRCRPLLSPAEFRIAVILGDEAAGPVNRAEIAGPLKQGDTDEIDPSRFADHYLRAHFIARFNPPAGVVVREVLRPADPFMGYDPLPCLFSDACILLAEDLKRRGNEAGAARLLEKANQAAPFLRLPADAGPAKLDTESEDGP